MGGAPGEYEHVTFAVANDDLRSGRSLPEFRICREEWAEEGFVVAVTRNRRDLRGAVSAFAVIFSVSNTCGLTPTMGVVGVSEWIDHTPNRESEHLYLSFSFFAIGAKYGIEPAR